ncbi:MAG: hypothetical protein IKS31_07920, partial [Clostridia bacterium]|nr:hypothetical protein [Clostridia bacterium]
AWHSIKNLTIPQELFNGTAPKESRGRSESPLVRPQAHSLTNGISLTKCEEPEKSRPRLCAGTVFDDRSDH